MYLPLGSYSTSVAARQATGAPPSCPPSAATNLVEGKWGAIVPVLGATAVRAGLIAIGLGLTGEKFSARLAGKAMVIAMLLEVAAISVAAYREKAARDGSRR